MTEYSLIHILRMLRKRILLLTAVAALTAVLGIAIAFLVTPIYRAEVTMIPADYNDDAGIGGVGGSLSGLASLAGVNLGSRDNTDEAVATLFSRSFVESFIKQNDLMPLLFADNWDSAHDAWAGSAEDVPTLFDGFERLTRDVMSLKTSTSSSIVRFRVDWHDPTIAADWANQLVARLNDSMRSDAIREAQQGIEFLNLELGKTNILGVQQGIYRLIEGRVQEIMLANVRSDYVFKVIDQAAAPDPDAWIRPNRLLIVIVSLVLGLILGAVLAILPQISTEESEQ